MPRSWFIRVPPHLRTVQDARYEGLYDIARAYGRVPISDLSRAERANLDELMELTRRQLGALMGSVEGARAAMADMDDTVKAFQDRCKALRRKYAPQSPTRAPDLQPGRGRRGRA